MNLQTLLQGFTQQPLPDLEVADVTLDSRAVRAGSAFVALPGRQRHGMHFAPQACAAGARAVVWQPVAGYAPPALPADVAVIPVEALSAQLGALADRFFGSPSAALDITAVTGTNGKTTTAYLIAAAFERLGVPSAYMGTIGVGRIGALRDASHTTPDCLSLHRELARLCAQGVRCVAMEVSSHALDQDRINAVRWHTAAFTNLTRDHLDYHGTMEAYGAAKAKLFDARPLQHAVVNVGDAFGARLAARIAARMPLITYTTTSNAPVIPGARTLLGQPRHSAGGMSLSISGSWGGREWRSPLIGNFNAENSLAALGALLAADVPFDAALAALAECQAPPGRLQTFTAPGRPLVVVDYAHTPDALENVLVTLRAYTQGHAGAKLVCVFGCGGDRDRGKRPLMGELAERAADVVVLTDDNPRTEDPDAIVAEIRAGMREPARAIVERDRTRATHRAIALAGGDDVVLIAGKGHEDYQIIGTERRYYSDQAVVQSILERRI
jgi:UDP-N-acetylmuramoyl-L-alanyl-D-glutamate--2,6-diaminopimelate ligase